MPGHVTHGAAPRRVFREKRTFSKCDAFSLRDRRGEGDFKELFFTFLILIVEAQVASAALGLSCAHGRQVPLPSTDQIKARELLTSADQTQALNSGTDTSVSRPLQTRPPPGPEHQVQPCLPGSVTSWPSQEMQCHGHTGVDRWGLPRPAAWGQWSVAHPLETCTPSTLVGKL